MARDEIRTGDMMADIPLSLGRIRCAIWFEACEKISGRGKGQARRGDHVLVLESCSIAGREMKGKICRVRERVGNWLHLEGESTMLEPCQKGEV